MIPNPFFIIDQFGVLHDGVKPIKGALDAVNLLKETKKSIVVLSNTSSRASLASKKFVQMGFPESIKFVTSGEVAWQYIGSEKEITFHMNMYSK
jgi:ribonucleotide monophosphatase NagD (HAD superfamily)